MSTSPTTQAPAMLSDAELSLWGETAAATKDGHDKIANANTVSRLLSHIASQAQTIAQQAAEVERLKSDIALPMQTVINQRNAALGRAQRAEARVSDLEAQVQRLPDEFKRRGSLPADHPDTFMNAADAHAWLCEVAEAALARATEAPTQAAAEAPHPCAETMGGCGGCYGEGVCGLPPIPEPDEATDTLAGELARCLDAHMNYWRRAVWPKDFTTLRNQMADVLDKDRAAGLLPTVTDGGAS